MRKHGAIKRIQPFGPDVGCYVPAERCDISKRFARMALEAKQQSERPVVRMVRKVAK